MEYFVYILNSDLTQKYYTGHTEDLERRMKEHNSGKSLSTRSGKPWKLVYKQSYGARSEAMFQEKSIKNQGAGRFLEKLIVKKIHQENL